MRSSKTFCVAWTRYPLLLNNYLPVIRWPVEWVGVAVLVLLAAAGWSMSRGGTTDRKYPPVRLIGIAALGALTAGMWIGIAKHVEFGAVVLAVGCCLSVLSVFLQLGLTWRSHIRCTTVPALLAVLAAIFGWYQPVATAMVLLLILIWARRIRRAASGRVDQHMNRLFTRVHPLTRVEAARYVVEIWFARFRAEADDADLLALAQRSRERSAILPRARSSAIAADSFRLLTHLADEALDERLGTARAAVSKTSWIRVLARDFSAQALRQTGIVRLAKLFFALLLAVPPARRNAWFGKAKRYEQEVAKPDPQTYVADLTVHLPCIPSKSDMDAVREKVWQDAATAGPLWLVAVAARAEQYRQERSASGGRDGGTMLCETIWSVYEDALGARPDHYNVFDQLRLQLPDLLAGLSVQGLSIDEERGCLIMTSLGLPKTFDELSAATERGQTRYGVVVETHDRREWVLRSIEVEAAVTMHLVFGRFDI